MDVGYARTSTLDQIAGLEAQVRDLRAAGCEQVYQEQASALGARPQPERAPRGIRLKVLQFGKETVDTNVAYGKLVLNMFSAIAEFVSPNRRHFDRLVEVGVPDAQTRGLQREPLIATPSLHPVHGIVLVGHDEGKSAA